MPIEALAGGKPTMPVILALDLVTIPAAPCGRPTARLTAAQPSTGKIAGRAATLRENAADTFLHGTHNRGSRNGQAKIDEVCVSAIRKMHSMQIPRRVAAEGFGLCRQAIDDIVNGKRWRHVR